LNALMITAILMVHFIPYIFSVFHSIYFIFDMEL